MNLAPRLALTVCLALTLGACAAPRHEAQGLTGAVAAPATAVSEASPPPAQPQPTPIAITLPTATPEPPPAPTAEPTATAAPVPTAVPAPTEDPALIAMARRPDRIIIDSIALNRTLVEVGLDGTTPVVPDYDVAWYQLSALPGTGENVVVWGHALRFGSTPDIPAPLERVKEARIGDRVTIVTADGSSFDYVISEQIWALPSQVDYILPRGHELLTIVNCIGDVVVDGDGQLTMTHRLITLAQPAW